MNIYIDKHRGREKRQERRKSVIKWKIKRKYLVFVNNHMCLCGIGERSEVLYRTNEMSVYLYSIYFFHQRSNHFPTFSVPVYCFNCGMEHNNLLITDKNDNIAK